MNIELAAAHADAIAATLGPTGRLLGMSKTRYRDAHPGHAVVFNANVCLPQGKIWYGDIDLTTDEPLLIDLAACTGQIVHVLYEWDGRFGNKDDPQLGEAVYSITPTGHTRLDHARFERRVDEHIYERQHPRPLRWRSPGRPRLWRVWHVRIRNERLGERRSHLLCIGERGYIQGSPALVLGLHRWQHEARGAWIEAAWYPGANRAWAPSVVLRLEHRGARVRPFVGIRLTPGASYDLRVGVVIGADNPTWL